MMTSETVWDSHAAFNAWRERHADLLAKWGNNKSWCWVARDGAMCSPDGARRLRSPITDEWLSERGWTEAADTPVSLLKAEKTWTDLIVAEIEQHAEALEEFVQRRGNLHARAKSSTVKRIRDLLGYYDGMTNSVDDEERESEGYRIAEAALRTLPETEEPRTHRPVVVALQEQASRLHARAIEIEREIAAAVVARDQRVAALLASMEPEPVAV